MNTTTPYRVTSIDVLRGLVMVIMALDHTRDFFHRTAMTADPLDPSTTSTMLYFTRWITHFCAPTFVFLSGVSAFLAAQRRTRQDAAYFLIKRGLWLVLVEVTLITLGLTFNPSFNFIILQVIWAIGWSMVILGLLSWWSRKAVLIAGILLFFGHNVVDYMKLPAEGPAAVMWQILLTTRGAVVPLDATHLLGIFYAILPWTGIMLLGYSIGSWFIRDFPAAKRKQRLVMAGVTLVALFVLLRWINLYGNPVPRKIYPDLWSNMLSFFDTSKYPPSLQYAAMTLGPALLALAAFENLQQKWSGVLTVYGRVPFFYYVLHFYLLHALLVIVFFATGHSAAQIAQVPFWFRPAEFGYALPLVYLIWIGVVAALYRPCRWFDRYRAAHRQWWLSYL
ncbi:Uncharacterized membrane protein [Chitinophaga eiseniae]|uniref:Uncharacterized membrane protein n=1 Tax=Chitinophaga eiseniae TaxID=634771 RepID=A0A1T4TZ80_9BACT|nr:heparan-alpha-glucosaminide N-acetyltransferase domain-containing protein [Chitinophaga eiseniae]SKA45777.1 Uncharacterized membrane protein [Chitinophaga eiseniae]